VKQSSSGSPAVVAAAGERARPEETNVVPELRLLPDPAPETATITEFANAMSALASGVVIVTCRLDDRPWGITVTSFVSVSLDPPTVLVSLGSRSTAARAIKATTRFGVSILAEEQLALARYASAPGTPKFLEPFAAAGDGAGASPVVAGALAHLDCRLFDAVQAGDHTVVFGRVRATRASDAGTPLLYHRRNYRTLGDRDTRDPPTERSTRCLAN
jgi:flavin reductase (DIM6/NTAB) family NADH-FMN oxidoreductase RutF